MEQKKIQIYVVNDGKRHNAVVGEPLSEVAAKWCPSVTDPKTKAAWPTLAVLVDHKLHELSYPVAVCNEVEFVGYNHPDGRRSYIRSLCFVLQKAVRDLFPGKVLVIDHSLPSGLYCELCEPVLSDEGRHIRHFLTDEDLERLKAAMKEIVAMDLPFGKEKRPADELIDIYEASGQPQKAALLRSVGKFVTNSYMLGGITDTFYGPLVPSTGALKVFDLMGFGDGFCLQPPTISDFSKVMPIKRQSKIASALEEYSDWCDIIGVYGLGTLNRAISGGKAVELINLAESLHERKYAAIADMIYQRRSTVKIVFIAGPSSSGKTSSSLRVALQCKVLGLNPKVIELDNYFLDREHTPKDENGEYDFESLHAMDLDLLGKHLNALLAGEEVEIPRFDFKTGSRTPGKKMRLEDKDILIMEGIHALNPEMVPSVDQSRIFRVYVSALTSLNIDENNNISTSDNRLLRRMVRDNRVRGIIPEETIMRWHSVRRGESRNIFPFQENADAIFNSALIFELPMLKYYAEPLLRRIAPASPAYTEAVRLLKFLGYITALSPSEIAAIPPTSIMREFIGGQTL